MTAPRQRTQPSADTETLLREARILAAEMHHRDLDMRRHMPDPTVMTTSGRAAKMLTQLVEAAAARPSADTEQSVIRIHYGNPDAYAEAWNDGWDDAHRQGVGGTESREWVLRQVKSILGAAAGTLGPQIADAVLAEVNLGPSADRELLRAIVHRWFDQVINTCDPAYRDRVNSDHAQLCAALDGELRG